MGELIYSKEYPSLLDGEGQESNFDALMKSIPDVPHHMPDFQEFYKRMHQNHVYVASPHRMELAKEFIRRAIAFSEAFKVSLELLKEQYYYSATFSFDPAGAMGALRSIIAMADEISFFTNRDTKQIVLSLDYYTHLHYSPSGRLIAPVDYTL